MCDFIVDKLILFNCRMFKPKAFCINLDRKPEQWKKIQDNWSDTLDLERFSAIDGKKMNITGKQALLNTTKKFFKFILNYNEHYIILIEDDIYKTNDFNILWPDILEFLNTKTNTWSFISLDPFLCFHNCMFENFNDIFLKVSNFRQAGFIIYRTEFIKQNISQLLKINKPFDISISYNNNYIKLTPKKLLVRQYTNKVSTVNSIINYNFDKYWTQTINILNLLNRISLVHIGKTGGTTIMDIFSNKNKIINHEYHSDKQYKSYEKYIIWIRNPITRFVSAFNSAYVTVNYDCIDKRPDDINIDNCLSPNIIKNKIINNLPFVYSKEYDLLINYFKTPNSLAEALSSTNIEQFNKANILMNLEYGHIYNGIGWYLNNGDFIRNRNKHILFVGKQETMKNDMFLLKNILNINNDTIDEYINNTKLVQNNYLSDDNRYLSKLAVSNLIKWYKDKDYAALDALYKFNFITKDILDSYYKYEFIKDTTDILSDINNSELLEKEHKQKKIEKEILCIGHPRCGTKYISGLLTSFGYEIGHENMKKKGISSWMLAVMSNTYPWGDVGIDKNKPFSVFNFKYIIHIVRNPFNAIPSIILENKYSPRSYNFRKFHIKRELNIDLPIYNSKLNLIQDIEIAIKTYIYWNLICEKNKPSLVIKLEDSYNILKQYNTKNIKESDLKIDKNETINKFFGNKKYNKPRIVNYDYEKVDDSLKLELKQFCIKYDYKYILE